VAEEFKLQIPDYGFGTSQIVEIEESATVPGAVCENSSRLEEAGGGDITALFVTASSTEEANKIARGLLEHNLVACVNLIPQVKSVYRWEGNVEESEEVLMIIKVGLSGLES
jgi:CutA1 divalent ion tolerance protein